MITRIIIISFLLALCFVLLINGAINGELGDIFWGIIFCCILTVVLVGAIKAQREGNKETVRYEFPSETYKFEKRTMLSIRDTLIDGDTFQVVDTSSVYVLTGVEPIFSTKESKNIKVKTRTILYE